MNKKITVIGLGYVGLPLARLFATKYSVVGFDINNARINDLKKGEDHTLEVESKVLKKVLKSHNDTNNGLFCTHKETDIQDSQIYIITVPTPVNEQKQPDLSALFAASQTVGEVLKKGDIVIYESTVYPGATEEDCAPILARASKLVVNQDFFLGYSPERINPGDKLHTIDKILKVTSGSTEEAALEIDALYNSVITAGTYLAPSIKVAEAAKVIENSQRDINIAFVNELAKIFNLMNINTAEVLKAAGTKWNFLPFTPGLVGGHCIGVDPYYLAQKAQKLGYHPEIILAGRRVNDSMASYVASQVVKLMLKHNIALKTSRVLVLGITFKENCPDVRNTKSADVVKDLMEYGLDVTLHDPMASPQEVFEEYGLQCKKELPFVKYDTIVLTVAHSLYGSIDLSSYLKDDGVIYDVKGILGSFANQNL